MKRKNNQRGAVLLLVLAVIALLSALLTDWAFSSLIDLRLAETFRDSTRAYYLARGGVTVGRLLLQEDRNGHDALDESWALGVPSYPVGEGGVISIAIEDQDGRLDLNRLVDAIGESPNPVYRDRLLRLLEDLGVGEKEALVEALFDWLDHNDAREANGAESAYYQTLSPPYRAKNGALESVDELLLIKGFTPEVLAVLAPYVTVTGSGQLNLNTASLEVLRCWHKDMTAAAAEQLVEGRRSESFKTVTAAKELLGDNLFAVLNEQGDLTVTSSVFRIVARAGVNDGARSAEALVKKSGDRLLYFKVD